MMNENEQNNEQNLVEEAAVMINNLIGRTEKDDVDFKTLCEVSILLEEAVSRMRMRIYKG